MSLRKIQNKQTTEGVNVSAGAENSVCREASLSERVTSTRWGKIIQSNCLKLLGFKSNQRLSRTKRFNCQETQAQHLLITTLWRNRRISCLCYRWHGKTLPSLRSHIVNVWRSFVRGSSGKSVLHLVTGTCCDSCWEMHNETQEKKSLNTVAITEVHTS